VYVEALPVSAKIAKCLNCDELKKEIASLGVEIATLDNLNKQIETLQHHKSKLGLKINWTAQPSKMMNKKIQYYNDDVINQWKIRVTALKTEVCKLRLELGTSAHVRATRGVMITDLEAMMVKRDERIDKLKDILHTVHRENKLLKQRVDDREGTIHVLKHRIDARGGTIEGLRRELITMHRVATALDKKNKEKIKHINRLKREYHTVREILHYVSKLFNGGK
jgi:antitoxin component HigA of HigAB toxin-antitoxin module